MKKQEKPTETYDVGAETQRLLISYMISDPTAYAMSQNIINARHFNPGLKEAVAYIKEFSDKFKTMPLPEQIKAVTGQSFELFPAVSQQHAEWYLDAIEGFTRYRALEFAITDGVELLQEGKFAEVETRVKDAVTISLMRDLGTDYFRDPHVRLERLRDRSNIVSTGWATLDEKLYGGYTHGSLNVFCGNSGAGKSLLLQNQALNWVYEGKNIVYFSLELSEDLIAMRMDSMVTGYGTKEIFKNMVDVVLKIREAKKGSGSFVIKKLPEAGTTANDIRAYMQEYEIKTGQRFDAIIVDYLDLMHPNNRRIDPSDLFVKDKYVSEELRAIGGDYKIPVVTASQLNRGSVEAQEYDHSHIAGGISKINTADNVFGIFATKDMKERGIYQLQMLKTRSSSAVGQKIELAFSPECLRITDKERAGDLVRPSGREDVQKTIEAKAASNPAEEPQKVGTNPVQDLLRKQQDKFRRANALSE